MSGPVLGFGILRRPIAYIHIGVSRHFPRPVGRLRQYDGEVSGFRHAGLVPASSRFKGKAARFRY